MDSNNAIVCLTRGYQELIKYDDLIKRNLCIEKFLPGYPMLIFHEGNIAAAHQEHIVNNSGTCQLQFIDISKDWAGGYEGMCQFHIYDIWKYCADYDYILRVDEDCHITQLDENPFENIGDNYYLRSVWCAESHSETNATLPHFLKELCELDNTDFYNHKFPYTNVSLSSVPIWLAYHDILKAIIDSPLQRSMRWGDLPVLGSLLNILEIEQGYIKGLTYYHGTHGNTVVTDGIN